MVPVKNQDLWRRIDRAMAIHQIDCRAWRFDGVADDFQTPEAQPLISSEPILQSPSRSPNAKSDGLGARLPAGTVHPLLGDKLLLRRNATSAQAIGSRSLRRRLKRWSISLQRRLRGGMERFYQSLAEFGTELLPKPWFQ